MALLLQKPLLYLITNGLTTEQTTQSSKDFSRVLKIAEAAVAARIELLQIREKRLTTRVLCELASLTAEITRKSSTKLLINDRADVAVAAGADGVHLTTQSIPVKEVRRAFRDDLLIGVSTHSFEEASNARDGGADFAVFGPTFDTASKRLYGEPVGLPALTDVVTTLPDFPVLALGGVNLHNVTDCARAGAHGIAAIRMFDELERIVEVANEARLRFDEGLVA